MTLTGFSVAEILSEEPRKKKVVHSVFKHEACQPNEILEQRQVVFYDYYQPLFVDLHRSFSPLSEVSRSSSPSPKHDPEDDKVTRRPRTSITMCQRDFLEREFQDERYPTLAYIDKLSRRIGLPQYVIKVWYQNRRAKYRKENHRRKRTADSSETQESSESAAVKTETEKKPATVMIDLTRKSHGVHPYHTKDKRKHRTCCTNVCTGIPGCKCMQSLSSKREVSYVPIPYKMWTSCSSYDTSSSSLCTRADSKHCICSYCRESSSYGHY